MDSRFSECQDPDLNWGHGDFQSPALPTELSRLGRFRDDAILNHRPRRFAGVRPKQMIPPTGCPALFRAF